MNTIVAVKYDFVMLIDDNPMENLVHRKLMDTNGFANKVQAFETAAESLAFLKTASTEELPNVIFLDIIMPGMDGFQFLDEFSNLSEEVQKKCKIILLSSSDSFKDLNRANKNKFVKKFLNKPLAAEMLNVVNV